jgi:hypothetical protein
MVARRIELRTEMMRPVFQLLGHLPVTLARLAYPGGVRAVVTESLVVKHQLLIMKGSQRRAAVFYTLLVSPKRMRKMRDAQGFDARGTSSRFGEAQISSSKRAQSTPSPGPKGPSSELVAAVIKRKAQPTYGLP